MKLHEHAKRLGLDVGCGDNSCIWGSPGGMGTNGGCRCVDKANDQQAVRLTLRQMARVATHLASEVSRHWWSSQASSSLPGLTACVKCGVVKRADDNNRPCRGVTRVEARSSSGWRKRTQPTATAAHWWASNATNSLCGLVTRAGTWVSADDTGHCGQCERRLQKADKWLHTLGAG